MKSRFFDGKNKNELFKKIEKGEAVINDCVETNLDYFEQDWLLNFDYKNEDIPEEYEKYIKTYKNKIIRRFFAVRDLYKYLDRPDSEIKFRVNASNFWWFSFLMSPELKLIKHIVQGKDYHCRLLANLIASYVNEEIKKIANALPQLEQQMKMNQNQNQNGQQSQNQNQNGNGQQDQNGNDMGQDQSGQQNKSENGQNGQQDRKGNGQNQNGNGNIGEQVDFTNLCMNNPELQNLMQQMIEKANEVAKSVINEMNSVGKGGVIRFGDKTEILDVELSEKTLRKIKNIGDRFYNFYETDLITQTTSPYPRSIDYALADDLLFLEKIANQNFVHTEHKSRVKIDVYLDCSGSMDGSKIKLAKGVLKELMRLGVKFRKFYAFNNELIEVENIKKLFSVEATGGTNINTVLKSVEKNNKKCLIVSDLEDSVDTENLKKLKNKISVVLIGSNEYYYNNYWRGIIPAVEIIKE